MPQAQFASLLRISHLIWPQMNPFLLLLLRPAPGDSNIYVSPRLGTPIIPSLGQGHVLTGHREWHWPIPASGCVQLSAASLCWPSLPLAELSPTRAFLFSSQKNSLLARDLFRPCKVPGQVWPSRGRGQCQAGWQELGRSLQKRALNQDLPASPVPAPGRDPWEFKTRGATASVENKSRFLLPPCLAVQRQQLRGRGDISSLPGGCPHWDCTGGCWKGCRTWTRPPVSCDNVEISCLWPRCFSRESLEQKSCFIRGKKPP